MIYCAIVHDAPLCGDSCGDPMDVEIGQMTLKNFLGKDGRIQATW